MTRAQPSSPPTIPSASSPQLLTAVLERLAAGVRSTRALEESLGVDARTVRYYREAGQWLGFLEAGDAPRLSELGLEYVYRRRHRRSIWRRAVWSQPFVAALLAGRRPELPSAEELRRAVRREHPDLASSTIGRKASGVRGLIAPALRAGLPRRLDQGRQLELPLTAPSTPPVAPSLPRGTQRERHPDVYRYVLQSLLDVGELTLGQLRALLDRADAADAPIGGYVDLALSRGDAHRVEDQLVISRAAMHRRDLATSTASIILSDPGYRAYLKDARASAAGDRAAGIRVDRTARRYRGWARRLLGHPLRPQSLDRDLRRVLMDRSLEEFPLAAPGAPPAEEPAEPFLYCWERSGLLLARPSWLARLQGGLAAVNHALASARQGGRSVSLPGLATRPVRLHLGLLHPGERLPRSVPDRRTLRQRLLMSCPWASLSTALLLVHRSRPQTVSIQRAGSWQIHFEGREQGTLSTVLAELARAAGWHPALPTHGGLSDEVWLRGLESVGVAARCGGDTAILTERLFGALRTEPEEMELASHLEPLGSALLDLLASRSQP